MDADFVSLVRQRIADASKDSLGYVAGFLRCCGLSPDFHHHPHTPAFATLCLFFATVSVYECPLSHARAQRRRSPSLLCGPLRDHLYQMGRVGLAP